MLPLNPYIAGNPVYRQGQFIGRTDVLRDVEQALHDPNTNAIILLGQRRIGKTSILLQIERALEAKHEFLPIYFDLQDKASLPLAQVLYQLAQKIAPTTKTPLPNRNRFDPEGRFFRETFIPQVVNTGRHQGLVLLLDEFEVLDVLQHEQAGATFFPYLRDWMTMAESMQFVFVLGRRPEELSTDTLSVFRSVSSRKISLMEKADTEAIIRQSEQNESLTWSDGAMERIWFWTQGHPYFTQLLCSEVWETVLTVDLFGDKEKEQSLLPPVKAEAVDAAIDRAIEQGTNALEWIWNGLPAAERIVMAAMAEVENPKITRDDLTEILNRSKVRLILREVDRAPDTLIRWDLLRQVEDGFRFAIPLLRRWIMSEKPLRRVKAELDHLNPLAESQYHRAERFYKSGDLEETERLLRDVLNGNPNHFRARLLLGQMLIGQGNPEEAVKELEPAYEFDARSAKSSIVRALLALADSQQNKEDQLATYEKILEIEPGQAIATKAKQALLHREIGKEIRS